MVSPNLTLPSQSNQYSQLVGRTIDNTALAAYMTCPRKYYYGYVLHRRKGGLPSPALCYGSGWHKALEAAYKSEPTTRDILVDEIRGAVGRSWTGSTDPNDYRTFDRCIVEFEHYIDRYGLPWLEPAHTVGWPDTPLVEIAVELPIPGARHPYTGKLDHIIDANGQFLIEDHKTASQMRSDYFKGFELDNQMIGYAVLAELVTGLPIAGVRINAHFIRKSDSVFERRTIQFTQERLKAWCKNYDQWLARIELGNQMLIDGYEEVQAFPQNFSACAGKYGMCTYADVCSMPPRLQQTTLEAYYEVNPWNPLEAEETFDA